MPLSPQEFIAQNLPIIDVRSPAEHAQAHIPNAINVPLFNDEERAKVGTVYKQKSKDAAVLLGLELVGPKLADFVREAKKIAPKKKLLIHCWRGGMRSGSFAWLLKTAGFEIETLLGGYKAYRNHVLSGFEQPYQLIVLGGKTGSGKTDVLKSLQDLGQQVIDLEGIAHHKGSSYGAIGQAQQPSSEHFENLLFEQLSKLDINRPIWVEDESRKIGACYVPLVFWQLMRKSRVVFLDIPKSVRVERLVKEYAYYDHQLLIDATNRIQKRMGGQHHKAAIDALLKKDYAAVVDITLNYYDKAYLFGLSERNQNNVFKIDIEEDEPSKTAEVLVRWLKTVTL